MSQTDIKNDPKLFRHSEEIRDIITTVPSGVLRWGITLFVGVFAMIIALAAIIHYPDIVTTTLTVSTLNSSGSVLCKSGGTIEKILVQPNEIVHAGQELAYIHDPTSGTDILKAPVSGRVTYSGIIRPGKILAGNQEVFYVNSDSEKFFGEIVIPQSSIKKIISGQRVIIKLNSYPYEQYGSLQGKIKYTSTSADSNGDYLAEVEINSAAPAMNKRIQLSRGMRGEADIITQDVTIFQRISRNMVRVIGDK